MSHWCTYSMVVDYVRDASYDLEFNMDVILPVASVISLTSCLLNSWTPTEGNSFG